MSSTTPTVSVSCGTNYHAVADRHGASTTVIYIDAPLALVQKRIRENDRIQSRGTIAETVLLDLVAKIRGAPSSDENVLVFRPGASPDGWIARHVIQPFRS